MIIFECFIFFIIILCMTFSVLNCKDYDDVGSNRLASVCSYWRCGRIENSGSNQSLAHTDRTKLIVHVFFLTFSS